jgi:zinc/manganese transport system substrate-binding protein
MPSPIRVVVAIVALGMLSSGCTWSRADATDADVVVVASTDVWGDVAASVGGAHVKVTSFVTSPSQDPHSFQASARDLLAVSKADVVLENGGGYDDFMGQLVSSADATPVVLDAVDISGFSTAQDGTLNEHVWYDLATVERVARSLARAFSDVDPAHAERYMRNAARFTASVDALRARESAMRGRFEAMSVAVTEPVPDYLLEDVGLVNQTPESFSEAIEEGSEVPVSVLEETLSLFTDHAVSALVYNAQTTGSLTTQAQDAAHDAGIPVVPVTETLPAGSDYLTWMRANLRRLDTALGTP